MFALAWKFWGVFIKKDFENVHEKGKNGQPKLPEHGLKILLVFFNVPENQIAQISSIIGAVGVLAIYILAEAYVDANRVEIEEGIEVEEKEK